MELSILELSKDNNISLPQPWISWNECLIQNYFIEPIDSLLFKGLPSQVLKSFFFRKLVCKLVMENPEGIIISKANASDFLRWLEGEVA